MNVHHLELFYYVARHKGISEAARRIPYGIQQPAISGQILQLENALGLELFRRRPFQLTSAGRRLYEFIFPFFSQLPDLATELKQADSAHLRLGASASTLAKHIPTLLQDLKAVFPKLKLTLREIPSRGSLAALQTGEIDVSLTVKPETLAPGSEFLELLKLPLILLVPEKSRYRSFPQLITDLPSKPALKTGCEPLLCLPEEEPLSQIFQGELKERNIIWEPQLEVSSADLAVPYVLEGFGVALYINVPGIPLPKGLRAIKLPKFPPLIVGLLSIGQPKPVVLQFAKMCLRKVRELRETQKRLEEEAS